MAKHLTTDYAPLMTAGACFMQPEEGSLRLVVGKVYSCMDDVGQIGIVVQEYVPQISEDGFELVCCEWRDICPLTDAHFMLPAGMPDHWSRASKHLRDLIERGEPVTLAIERATLTQAKAA
jgi:hypothetical protein